MHFSIRTLSRPWKGQSIHVCTVITDEVQSLYAERSKYVLKRDIDDGSDGVHLK